MNALDNVPSNVLVVAAEMLWLILSRQRMISVPSFVVGPMLVAFVSIRLG